MSCGLMRRGFAVIFPRRSGFSSGCICQGFHREIGQRLRHRRVSPAKDGSDGIRSINHCRSA